MFFLSCNHFSKITPTEVKWPIIEKSPGKVTTHMPNGEKLIEHDDGGTSYFPPDYGEPAFVKNKDGKYTLKQKE